MVPVRFFSQVLGYDVFWDNGYRMAFLLDEETFAEKVDSRLTILNGYLAGNAKRFDASKNYKEDVTLSGTVKVIDSIKGDRSYPYSGKASVLLGKDGMSMSLSADLGDLAELLEGLAGEKLPETYRAALIKPELEAIYGDKLYYKSPLFDALMAEVGGTQAVSGAWYATDAVMSFADLRASMYGSNEDYTVGKALYAERRLRAVRHVFQLYYAVFNLVLAYHGNKARVKLVRILKLRLEAAANVVKFGLYAVLSKLSRKLQSNAPCFVPNGCNVYVHKVGFGYWVEAFRNQQQPFHAHAEADGVHLRPAKLLD